MIVVLAEKPSVARDLAAVLGAHTRRQGYFEGAGHRVTWAIGHLVGLAEPHDIDPRWKTWSYATLPMLPADFPLSVLDSGRAQYQIVERLLRDPNTRSVIAATDAGREGELIFRYIYERVGCTKPWQRLWISSLTDTAIRQAFARLEPGARYDALAAAAKARSRADWLVGMNLSRAYTLAHGTLYSVGRVQTPTLAMVCERDRQIRAFVPEHYLEVEATFSSARGSYRGTWFPWPEHGLRNARGELRMPPAELARLPIDGARAQAIVQRTRAGSAQVLALERKPRRTPPPLLYDLTELQRHANRLFGFTAKHTLDTAQALYEKHKVLSYPRTDSRQLSHAVAETLPEVVRTIAPAYADLLAAGSGERALGSRYVDDGRVTDHHAIIPTSQPARLAPNSAEAKIYDLVCRRLLMAWHSDRVEAVTTVFTEVSSHGDGSERELFATRGSSVEEPGWTVLERTSQRMAAAPVPTIPAGLREGEPQQVTNVEALAKQTEPPKHYTEATLLTAMETAGRALDDKTLMEALRESGLGTPATRAATIETLLARGYLLRDAKNLRCTPAGEALIDAVHAQVKSAAMTGSWELRLRRMEHGEDGFETFMQAIAAYVREVVEAVAGGAPASAWRPRQTLGTPPAAGRKPRVQRDDQHVAPNGQAPAARQARADRPLPPLPASLDRTERVPAKTASRTIAKSAAQRPPTATHDVVAGSHSPARLPPSAATAPAPAGLGELLQQRFGHRTFRPHQQEVCAAVAAGRDALVVMPTGAGKSLCYQLPGLARGGCTLVISPLIALIDDQCGALRGLGLRAEAIHSGRDRLAAREVCMRYLRGELDYLFIAPERLRVPGFPALLAKRPPALIAIDEAHCISQWGHDFRPDYRMLRERLAGLRPTPIVALTATATPVVQRDILEQLAVPSADTFILGFWRSNLAIEVVSCDKARRAAVTLAYLTQAGRLPAIVYAPTRQHTEEIVAVLGTRLRAGAYHAGLASALRARVQAQFLAGQLDCIVATIAFGMGIDKPNVRTVVHTALPSSLEGYYQEIGRAGRDGLPSRALLLHGPNDRRMHEFFLERDYPPEAELTRLHKLLGSTPLARAQLAQRMRKPAEHIDKLLEKLWIHGAANIDGEDLATRGARDFRPGYLKQRQHRVTQLELVAGFVRSTQCRMLALTSHFGDGSDTNARCGSCDVCAPAEARALALSHDPRLRGVTKSSRKYRKRRKAKKSTGRAKKRAR